jgi:nucleoside-diphosphate-sugar epimerase
MRVAIFGASGFVGTSVAQELHRRGHAVSMLAAPRLTAVIESLQDVHTSVDDDLTQGLKRALSGHDVVVNCAGLAMPDAPLSPALTGANAVLPVLLYRASHQAGAQRFIHVSSAAVQGRRPILDESLDFDWQSPYARSKGLGELALLEERSDGCDALIYRATSVQSMERSITRTLLRLAHLRRVPLVGDGQQPLPLSLRDTTADAVAHLCEASQFSSVNVHPWEGMTAARFLHLVNPKVRFVPIPTTAALLGVESLWTLGTRLSSAAAVAKRIELLTTGQRSISSAMHRSSFHLPAGDAAYARLGVAYRQEFQ